MMDVDHRFDLIASDEPDPVEVVGPDRNSPVLLVCEHAGKVIPRSLGQLGLTEPALSEHIAWDIGAEALARRLADRLGAPLVVQRYSRLVIDCNRPPGGIGSIVEVSDGIRVPGNEGMDASGLAMRRSAIFDPFDREVRSLLDRGGFSAAFPIHSFSPELGGKRRPWNAGFLTRKDPETAETLIRSIGAEAPELSVSWNQPYQIDDETDWFVPQYAELRGLKHALIEIRNDELRSNDGIERWAALLNASIRQVLEIDE